MCMDFHATYQQTYTVDYGEFNSCEKSCLALYLTYSVFSLKLVFENHYLQIPGTKPSTEEKNSHQEENNKIRLPSWSLRLNLNNY